jgi:4-aminobutyrate aminotransferase/(S)-3-amino-2-methylpropionate transaminase
MEKFDLVNRAKEIEAIMVPRLHAIAEQTGVIGEVRGRGAMIAVEVVQAGTHNPDPELTAKVAKACHAQGLVVLTAGTYGNVLRFLPPLVIPNHLLTEALDIITEQFVAATA